MYVFLMLLDYDNTTTAVMGLLVLSMCYANHYMQTFHVDYV